MQMTNLVKKIIPYSLILVIFVSVFAFGESLNFGPINAIDKKIDEYKAKKIEQAKANKQNSQAYVTSISPSTAANNGAINVTISGQNFVSGTTVKLACSGLSDITATNVVVVNSNQITCTFDLTGKTAGYWQVCLCNANPFYSFTITQAPITYGTIKGTITDAFGNPVNSAYIYLDGTSVTSSDTSGNYTISNVTVGVQHTVGMSYSGPTTPIKQQTVTVQANQTATVNIADSFITMGSSLSGNYTNGCYLLSVASSPYTVTASVLFNRLKIEPGVTIKFAGYYQFQAMTVVVASGTSTSPIKFTSGRTTPAAGDYDYLRLGNSESDKICLNYVTFEYGNMQDIEGVIQVTSCTFKNTNSDSARFYFNGTVSYCSFGNGAQTYNNVNLSHSTISGGSTSLEISGNSSGGTPNISYCAINGNIYISGYQAPTISYCNITGSISAYSSAGQYKINYCNLTKGSAPVLSNSANWVIDATNNWWGTTTSATIASYISSSAGTINYTPYLSSSVSTAGP